MKTNIRSFYLTPFVNLLHSNLRNQRHNVHIEKDPDDRQKLQDHQIHIYGNSFLKNFLSYHLIQCKLWIFFLLKKL